MQLCSTRAFVNRQTTSHFWHGMVMDKPQHLSNTLYNSLRSATLRAQPRSAKAFDGFNMYRNAGNITCSITQNGSCLLSLSSLSVDVIACLSASNGSTSSLSFSKC
eukprot:m.179300 g.179300  ORF g.179300 m.179300 type:complete len:106 (-) comp16846_c0_seq18:1158-1475(-)